MALQLIALALAVFRVTRLIVTDGILDKSRDRFFTRFPSSETVFAQQRPDTFWSNEHDGWMAIEPSLLGDLVSCVWCVGFWISVLGTAAWGLWPDAVWWISLPFALSAVAGLLSSWE